MITGSVKSATVRGDHQAAAGTLIAAIAVEAEMLLSEAHGEHGSTEVQ